MVRPRSKWWWVSLTALLALVAAACGTEGDGTGDTTADGEERTVIRFAFAPDPVWDYMNDTGMIVEWEEEYNTRIVTSSTWDEFTFFAGGHGDIVSMGTQEIPVLEQETGMKTVTFGKYNYQRSPMMRRADDTYAELTDVPPGEHQIRLWHEAWWTEDGRLAAPLVVTRELTVRPGEQTSVTFDLSDPSRTTLAGSTAVQKEPNRAR